MLIKSVQRFTGNVPAIGSTPITITAVVMDKTRIGLPTQGRQSSQDGSVTFTLVDETTVEIANNTSDTNPYTFEVIEYN